jgi:hypothetical protein
VGPKHDDLRPVVGKEMYQLHPKIFVYAKDKIFVFVYARDKIFVLILCIIFFPVYLLLVNCVTLVHFLAPTWHTGLGR